MREKNTQGRRVSRGKPGESPIDDDKAPLKGSRISAAGGQADEPTSRMVHIYGLVDPRTETIMYVGKAKNPRSRLAQHLRDVDQGRMTPCKAWIKSLIAVGQRPLMKIIEKCPESDWPERERYHIAALRSRGFALKNLAEGGSQPYCDPETLAAHGRRLASSPDQPLWGILRYFREAAKGAAKVGDVEGVKKFTGIQTFIKQSTGETRERFRQFALEKGFGKKTATA